MKLALLAAGALVASATSDLAADIDPAAEPAGSFFGYVEGGYIFNTSSNLKEYGPDETGTFDDAKSGDGWDGAVKLGYRFGAHWEIAIGGRHFDQSTGKRNDDTYDWQNTDGKYWNADLEIGYVMETEDAVFRPFAGVRYQDWKSEFTDHIATPTYSATNKSWGVGPRVGFDGAVGIADRLTLFGGADASVLFGKIKADGTTGYFDASSDNRTFWTAGAKVGLGWAITPDLELGAGYKVEWLDAINYETFNGEGEDPEGRGGELIHGPFGRLSLSFP